jgi:hypothetical protein
VEIPIVNQAARLVYDDEGEDGPGDYPVQLSPIPFPGWGGEHAHSDNFMSWLTGKLKVSTNATTNFTAVMFERLDTLRLYRIWATSSRDISFGYLGSVMVLANSMAPHPQPMGCGGSWDRRE